MHNQSPLAAEFEPNDFEEVSGMVWADGEHSRWVRVGLDIDNDKRLSNGVLNGVVEDAVLVGRPVDLHTYLS